MQCNSTQISLLYCIVLYCTSHRQTPIIPCLAFCPFLSTLHISPSSFLPPSLPPSLQHSIKKSCPDVPTLKEYFDFSYGAPYSIVHQKAVQNFVKSLVGYSLITYLLQVSNGLCDKSVCTVWNMRQKASTASCLVVHLYYTALYPHCPACLCHAELCCR